MQALLGYNLQFDGKKNGVQNSVWQPTKLVIFGSIAFGR
jgi:hypothetical protein